ncbi:hypothetical protein D3C72_1637420 [compost metagenome]
MDGEEGAEDLDHAFAAEAGQQVRVAATEEQCRGRQREGQPDGQKKKAFLSRAAAGHGPHEQPVDEEARDRARGDATGDRYGVGQAGSLQCEDGHQRTDDGELALHRVDDAGALEDDGHAHADEGVDEAVDDPRKNRLDDETAGHDGAAYLAAL